MVQPSNQLVPASSIELMAFSGGATNRQLYAGLNRKDTAQNKFVAALMRANIGDGTGNIGGFARAFGQ